MYDLYPPVFIYDSPEKIEYIGALSKSYQTLLNSDGWNDHTAFFFEQELDRILATTTLMFDIVNKMGNARIK